jgi:very-short-patch-repair endonuclease
MSEPVPLRQPEPSDDEKILAVERYYRACWACISAGAHHKCRHYAERRIEPALNDMLVSSIIQKWMATLETEQANVRAFRGEHHPDASPIEVRLLQAFWDAGLEPVQQYGIAGYIVDFAFPRARLAVEADGADYHQNTLRERTRDEAIRRQGWHIVHFTGSAIYNDAASCVRDVYRLARSSLV